MEESVPSKHGRLEMGERRSKERRESERHESERKRQARAHMYPSSPNILLHSSEWPNELTKVD